ncbi:MAG TPA: rhomboid family intramembrane serine protease [Steroidobacteraceae bacterium]|nr:rhomboid family intramembrane serine protease [Steroidobacteraceae bacterium]
MNTLEPRVAREFRVHFSTGQPTRADQPLNNTFGLRGEGKLIVDANGLTFEGERSGFKLGFRGPPRIALADVANVDYNAASNALLIRSRNGEHYIIVWATSREDAEGLWALLPQEKTPEFLADQEHHDRFAKAMSVLGARSFVTPSIIAINVAVFIAMLFAGADLMNPNAAIHIRFGSNFGPLTWTGQEWRLLTSAFLHFGLIHIALNMYALYQGGALVERLFGSTRFALIYLLAAISGSVASGWWDPLRNSAGASGAIFGVYGALLAFLAVRRADIPPSMLKSISSSALLFCLYSLFIGWAHPLIDNACHVGGLLAGFLSGVILARPFTPEARAVAQPAKLVIAALAIGLPLILLAQPLVAENGSHAAGLRFERDLENFGPVEADLVRRQTDILTYQPNVRVNRLEIAQRLRQEVLIPWREASKPLLQSATLPQDDSRPARVQAAMRDYLRAREQFLALKILSLESADVSDEARAVNADRRLGMALNQLDVLQRE